MDYPSLNTLHLDPLPLCLGAVHDKKCLESRQGLSRRTHFYFSSAACFWKCKLFLQLADLLHVDDIN